MRIQSLAGVTLPDGRLFLATASFDGIVRIWDGHTATLLHTLTAHTGPVNSVAWATLPDGHALLATASFDGTARIWDGHTATLLHTLTAHTDAVHSVAWATLPDGHALLATASIDGTARIWDGHTATLLHTLTAHTRPVNSAAWATLPDGHALLATASIDGTVRIWDGHTGILLHTRRSPVRSVAWATLPDGHALLATASYNGTVRIWDGHTSTLLHTLTGHTGPVYSTAWATLPDGHALLATTSYDGTARIWDGHTGTPLHILTAHTDAVHSIDWIPLPDGGLLVASSVSSEVHMWDIQLDPPPRPFSPAPALDHRSDSAARPRTVLENVEEITPTNSSAELGAEKTDRVACVALDDGRFLLATASSDGTTVRIWDGHTGTPLHALTAHTGSVWSVAWIGLPDGHALLATASNNGTARIWDGHTGTLLHTLTAHTRPVCSVAWIGLPDGRLLLATGSYDNTARIWDGHTATLLHTLTAHTEDVWSVAWIGLPDGRLLLATASIDNTARIWDGNTGTLLHTLTAHTGWVNSVSWVTPPDGRPLLATAGDDHTARVWDGHTGTLLHTLTAHTDNVWSAAWAPLPDGRPLLATASDDGTARIWDGHTGTELYQFSLHDAYPEGIDWAPLPDGRLLLAAARGHDPIHSPARIWELRLDPPVGHASPTRQARPRSRPGIPAEALLTFGGAGVWPPIGLIDDLVTLTGPRWTGEPALNDGRLGTLAERPGIRRLRDLGWPRRARLAFAALLVGGLTPQDRYVPPAEAEPSALRAALAASLGRPGSRWGQTGTDVAELTSAAEEITTRTITLLTILGPAACATDPLLPLRLAHRIPQLPALNQRQLRFLAAPAAREKAGARRSGAGTSRYSPGTADITRHGPLTALLGTQLALPPDLMALRHLENQLLYRRHLAPVPPTPEPVVLLLDTTPPTHGQPEQVLRMVAHLMTTELWEHDRRPTLISLTDPGVAAPLAGPADLARLWSTRTLEPPLPALRRAMETAREIPWPVVLLTHHHTAQDAYPITERTRLVTTHHPPETAPRSPRHPRHRHLPPDPTREQLRAAVHALLLP
ncbi:WD40 repeat domain-containing protein [Streptosporangium sp. NPDC023825]|uniref:WD40 repeat domain-containing protein n=1 Tax=Streptosporangium sp. NPDC023825 TaxID=3154909 RepID=UPI00342F7646